MERVIPLMEKAVESDPANPSYREYLWAQYQNLAIAYMMNGSAGAGS